MSRPTKPTGGDRKPSLVAAARSQSGVPGTTGGVGSGGRNIIPLSGSPTPFTAGPSGSISGMGSGVGGVGGLGVTGGHGQISVIGGFGGVGGMTSTAMSSTSSRTISDGSRTSTPGAPDIPGTATPAVPVQRMKFKPTIPIRRAKLEPDVKPDISTSALSRGAPRGRGRGGSRGRGLVHSASIAAGPFGGPRPASSSSGGRIFTAAPPPRDFNNVDAEVYSDGEEPERQGIIDIDAVSNQHPSAPTSVYRDRNLKNDKMKGKSKIKEAKEAKKIKKRKNAMGTDMDVDMDLGGVGVKAEPVSPNKETSQLPPMREDDTMLSEDEAQDRDASGRRVRAFARTGGVGQEGEDEEDVNEAQKVDLSESESEDENEDMEGDFVQAEGYDSPEDKLFIFQFPHLFPKFHPSGPVDLTAPGPANASTTEDVKPEIKDAKPTAAKLRGRKKVISPPPPEGRIGTMVVMRSGKVKMILGEDVVMNVTPGVSASFIQQIVHVDAVDKSANVLGEVHRQYVVTPDIDRLLGELFMNGGQTPADKEAERKRLMRDVKTERGWIKLEVD